jgi:hypothetical protein
LLAEQVNAMPNSPTQAPAQAPVKKEVRFQAEMPSIPGVQAKPKAAAGVARAHASDSSSRPAPQRIIIIALAALLAIGGAAWWHFRASGRGAHPAPAADVAENLPAAPVPAPAAAPPAAMPIAPGPIATLTELSKPWTSRKFTFVNPDTHESVPAMVVRLPGAGDRSAAYWAFSLIEPFVKCNLDYLTDLGALSSRFHYSATHPMVASACDGTLYDPLRMGMTPSGAWARGEMTQGSGIRPPTAIRVQVSGSSVVADRIEIE